jgi:type VI secretion system protein VasG
MAEISRVALFGKLNSVGYKAIESATVFCKLRGNPYVELVHWLHQILQLAGFGFAPGHPAFQPESGSRRQGFYRGAGSVAARGDLDLRSVRACGRGGERGWVYATLMFGDAQVRTGHLLVGMLKTSDLRNALLAISREFDKVKLDVLTERVQRYRRTVRRKPGCAPATALRSAAARRPARPARRWRRRRWASRKLCNAFRWI